MIRDLNYNDLDVLNKIGSRIKNNFNSYYSIEDILDKDYVNIRIYDNNGIKGFIFFEDHIDFIDLIAIAVSEDGKGIGTLLINDMLEKSLGKKILLEVRKDNINAIKLYEKMGFKIINVRKKYYDGIDALIMEVIN